MVKPHVVVLSGQELFESFFDLNRRARLGKLARWTLSSTRQIETDLTPSLSKADALITTWDSPYLSAPTVKKMPSLRLVAHCGGEVKRRFDASLFRKLVIVNTPEPMAAPTAELAATFLLYSARNVDMYRTALRKRSNRIYKDLHTTGGETESLVGREVGMIGFGRIARTLVDLLRGFDVRWRVYDPFAAKKHVGGTAVRFDSLNGVLSRSSMLVVAAAATEKTRDLLNKERLASLPDGAVVINVARGSLIDLQALTLEVKSGRLRCALDVTDPEEPLPVDHPLRTMAGAVMTPHIGGGGRQARGAMADAAMDEMERFFAGEAVHHQVTNQMLSRMT